MITVNNKQVSLMFSGGLDSTTAALQLAEAYDQVHLLTYFNGHGHLYINNSAQRARELQKIKKDKFTHSIISIEDIFKQMVIDKLLKNYQEYKSGFIWCLGCKMCMHTKSIIYNLKNNIGFMADGSSADSDEMVEQMSLSVALIALFYEKYKINYFVPVYQETRQEKIKKLKQLGLRMGLQIGNRFLGVQPKCIPGELYYLPYLCFNKAMEHEKQLVAKFIKEKNEFAEEYIKGQLKNG
jgi:predicted subunit of tRNA(5-methylaminomethyl-2-thiouridylate) methyltransferase